MKPAQTFAPLTNSFQGNRLGALTQQNRKVPTNSGGSIQTVDAITFKESHRPLSRIALPLNDRLAIIGTGDILYCNSENNYTRIHLVNGSTFFLSKTLKKVEILLVNETTFFRIHQSYLINLNYVQFYLKANGGEIVMTNGTRIPISRVKKNEFLGKLMKL